jgi:hypothetical protein
MSLPLLGKLADAALDQFASLRPCKALGEELF